MRETTSQQSADRSCVWIAFKESGAKRATRTHPRNRGTLVRRVYQHRMQLSSQTTQKRDAHKENFLARTPHKAQISEEPAHKSTRKSTRKRQHQLQKRQAPFLLYVSPSLSQSLSLTPTFCLPFCLFCLISLAVFLPALSVSHLTGRVPQATRKRSAEMTDLGVSASTCRYGELAASWSSPDDLSTIAETLESLCSDSKNLPAHVAKHVKGDGGGVGTGGVCGETLSLPSHFYDKRASTGIPRCGIYEVAVGGLGGKLGIFQHPFIDSTPAHVTPIRGAKTQHSISTFGEVVSEDKNTPGNNRQ